MYMYMDMMQWAAAVFRLIIYELDHVFGLQLYNNTCRV